MTRITLMTVLLLATACGDDFERPNPIPGDRYELVQDELLEDTCAEGSPPFKMQRTHYLDIHPSLTGESHSMLLYDIGGTVLWQKFLQPTVEPWHFRPLSQETPEWPPTQDWTEEAWATQSASATDTFDWDDYIYPTYRAAAVLDLDGDALVMEYVWDLNGCDRSIDCEPWGGRPCTRHIRKTFAFDQTLPDYAWRIGTLPDD